MNDWLPFFVAVTALAVVAQAAVLAGIYLTVRKTSAKVTRIAEDFEHRSEPILSRVRLLLDDTQPRLSAVAASAAEIADIARRQALKVDRVFTEAVDRLRTQVVRADQILTGAMEALEDAGGQLRKTVIEPVQQATAVLRGIKTGIDFFRSQRRPPAERPADHGDEELFI